MLAGGLDLLYRGALAAQHEPVLRIEVWKGGKRVDQLVPPQLSVGDGLVYANASVSAQLQSRVVRTLSMEVHEELYPLSTSDLLSESGTELHAWRGIRFGDGMEYQWQTFVGKISTVGLTDSGTVQVKALDRADEVIANGFLTPASSQVGNFVDDEIRRVIAGRLDGALFGASDSYDQTVPPLTWEYDPGKACDEMATSVGSFWYPLANGRFVVRRYPWTVKRAPVVTLKDGPGGIVTASNADRSRAGVSNVVTVVGEQADGTLPSFATATDLNPDSPTYALGPFGRRTKLVRLNTPTSTQNAQFAASQLLKRLSALTETWSLNVIPDASLELGDVLGLEVRGRSGIVQVIASFTLPMTVEGTMTLRLRSQVVDQLADTEV